MLIVNLHFSPKDYISPFKSSVRSSNRTKRRTCVIGSNFKQTNNSHISTTTLNSSATHNNSDTRSSTNSSSRHRLRGRNTSSPVNNSKGITAEITDSSSRLHGIGSLSTSASSLSVTENTAGEAALKTVPGEEDEQLEQAVPLCPENGRNTPLTSVAVVDKNDDRRSATVEHLSSVQSNGRASKNSFDRLSEHPSMQDKPKESKASVEEPTPPSEPLGNVDCRDPELQNANKSSTAPNTSAATTITTTPCSVSSDPVNSDDDEDDEINNSYPIKCPLSGCQKRFTHMTALRFHLNHTIHNGPKGHTEVEIKRTSNTAPEVLTAPLVDTSAVQSLMHRKSTSQSPLPCSNSQSSRFVGLNASQNPPRAVVPPTAIHPLSSESNRPEPAETDTPNHTDMRHLGSHGLIQKIDPAPPFVFGSVGVPFGRAVNTVGTVTHEQSSSGVSTRTVTAHTVSIPHGPLVDKVDLVPTGRTGSSNTFTAANNDSVHHSHSHHVKKNNSSHRNTDLIKLPRTNSAGNPGRVQSMNLSHGSSCPKPNELSQHQQQVGPPRHPSNRYGPKELTELSSYLPSSTGNTIRTPGIQDQNFSASIGTTPQFGNNLALFSPSSSSGSVPSSLFPNTPRVDSANLMFAVPSEAWLFPTNNAGEQRLVDSFPAETSSTHSNPPVSHCSAGPGLWMNGVILPPGVNPPSPTNTPNGYNLSHQSHGSTRQIGNLGQVVTPPSNNTVATVPGPVALPATTLNPGESSVNDGIGIPDFLMAAAAMGNALRSAYPMNNPAVMEMFRSYINPSLGKGSIHTSQMTQSIFPPSGPQAPNTARPLSNTVFPQLSAPQLATVSQGNPNTTTSLPSSASLASVMMAASANGLIAPSPALLSSSMLNPSFGLGQNQTTASLSQSQSDPLSSLGVTLDQLDHFKFSAGKLIIISLIVVPFTLISFLPPTVENNSMI